MKFSKRQQFFAAVFFQLLVIVGLIVYKFIILGTGTDVVLKIMPVDPRDPLRGDYVTFRYDISEVIYSTYYDSGGNYRNDSGDMHVRNGDVVYVSLYKTGEYWKGEYANKRKPTDGSVYIKGTVISGGWDPNQPVMKQFGSSRIVVKYGVEEYFIPEGTGTNIAEILRGGNAYAIVRVDDNGNAVLRKLIINGKPWPQ